MNFFEITSTILSFIAGAALSIGLTPLSAKIAWKIGAVDHPDERRIHSTPTPRLGGLSIFIIFFTLSGILIFTEHNKIPSVFSQSHWWALLLSSSILVCTGIFDDIRSLTPLQKLSGQATAALIMFVLGCRIEVIFGIPLHLILSIVVTLSWYIFVTNTFNLVDGIDGLATGLAALSALGIGGALLFRTMPLEVAVLAVFVGSALGFLVWNRNPAKVFLGDTGSNFIGFLLADIMLLTSSKGSVFATMWIPLLTLTVPFLDTVLAIWRRGARYLLSWLIQKEHTSGIMTGDLDHLHHRLIRLGFSQRDVAAFLYLINASVIFVSLACLPYESHFWGLIGFALLAAVWSLFRFCRLREVGDTMLVVYHLLAKPPNRLIAVFLYLFIDWLALSIALILSVKISHPDFYFSAIIWSWRSVAPIWILPILLILIGIEGTHHSEARATPISRRMGFMYGLIVASINICSGLMLTEGSVMSIIAQVSLFTILSFLFLSFPRLLLGLLEKVVVKTGLIDEEIRSSRLVNFYGRLFSPIVRPVSKQSYYTNQSH